MSCFRVCRLLLLLWAAAALALAGVSVDVQSACAEGAGGVHENATAALDDLQVAMSELKRAAGLTVNDAQPYKEATQRALNAVAGSGDASFKANVGNPGDAQGALGHLGRLLHNAGERPWTGAVRAASVNATVAKARMLDALEADDIDEFQVKLSGALEALDVAIGRDSSTESFGGLEGALATTELGVPAGARTLSGCGEPTSAPAYGVVNGYLLYVALPNRDGDAKLAQSLGVKDISISNGFVVLHTPAASMTAKLCAHRTEKGAAFVDADAKTAGDPATKSSSGGGHKAGAGLYTEAQAQAGKQVAVQHCISCHGGKLQGLSAPAIAGTAFMQKGKALGWSVSDLRTVVVNTMPRDNPGSLKPQQYAQVMAYLLAVNCYPAGNSKFPTESTPKLKQIPVQPQTNAKSSNGDGTCTLGQRAQTMGKK